MIESGRILLYLGIANYWLALLSVLDIWSAYPNYWSMFVGAWCFAINAFFGTLAVRPYVKYRKADKLRDSCLSHLDAISKTFSSVAMDHHLEQAESYHRDLQKLLK